MKALLLENDNFLWAGLDDFCKSFDPEYKVINVDVKRNFMPSDDYNFVALLSQPFVERCIVASAFETKFFHPLYSDETNDFEGVWQLEHFINLILSVIRFREKMKYTPLTFEINYHGIDFIKDINDDKWGDKCKRMFDLIIRQNVDNLTVNLYQDYKFIKRIEEKDFIL